MDESKAPRADVPAMLREIRHEECRCVTASDVGVPATGNPLVYGECPACSLVGLLADYAAAADALRELADDFHLTRSAAAYDAARAALAKALKGGEGC